MSFFGEGTGARLQRLPVANAQQMADLMMDDGTADSISSMGDFSADMLPFDLNLNAGPDADINAFNNMALSQGNHDVKASIENGDSQHGSQHISGVGAGPLPTGFGVPVPPGTGSTVTEFTKRRNWSQRVLEELKDFLYILTPDGRLTYASPSARALTGHDAQSLVGKFISEFLHPDDSNTFVREFNESIATGNPLRFFYRFRKPDGSYVIFESHGHPHLASESPNFGNNANAASFCRGFFMMARPYPTRNAALLDSFLEHKIENERLRKRIAELKREEQEEMEGQQRRNQVPAGSNTSPMNSESQPPPSVSTSATPATPNHFNSMPPPAKPSVSSTALTRRNLNEALAASRPDSINDKMARYEGATHIETIEMLTGLRYRDGERSKGISTGAASPTLIRGDAGIAIPVDKDGRPAQGGRYSGSPYDSGAADKKKKMKIADEYVCTDCGTLDSPEWRKGPSGPKTLCNACGLRWAKKEKKIKTPGDSQGKSVDNGSGEGTRNGLSESVGSMQPRSPAMAPGTSQMQGMMPPAAGLPTGASLNSMPPALPETGDFPP